MTFRVFPLGLLLAAAPLLPAQTPDSLTAAQRARIDSIASAVLTTTGVPSASVAVVMGDHLVYAQAYGHARLDPATSARPDMRYAIGSISKQFTAAAILMLAEQGKLSLDDPVSRFLPTLTRAHDITIRQLLSHTSGYQDYWPEDYVMPPMLHPTTPDDILKTWASKPLDFEPGTKWQYSNTNYVAAGRIVEIVSKMPLAKFLQKRVFGPLDMKGVVNVDTSQLSNTDAAGYLRYALGPARPAPKEARGWLFAMAELGMPVSDLAKWDIALLQRRLMSAASYEQFGTPVHLKDSSDTHYALGIEVNNLNGHRVWSHSGEVSGFVAENMVFPDDHAAIIVLTNLDASGAAGMIARGTRQTMGVIPTPTPVTVPQPPAVVRARMVFTGLQRGEIDRTQFAPNANAYFSTQALADYSASLGPLGTPSRFCQVNEELRGGMTFHAFAASFPERTVVVTTYEYPDGKLEQYLVEPVQGAGPPCQP